MTNYQSKKEQFTQPQKSKMPVIIAAVVVVVVATILFSFFNKKSSDSGDYFGAPVAQERSYIGQLISMTTIEPDIVDGKVMISLDEVSNNNIVYFELPNSENDLVPLMAYITPSGRLFAGSSMCEPCRGRTFSLAGETLVCDTCKTTYNVETHEFLSGAPACGKLPPINMNPTVDNGIIVIDYNEVLKWRIRT